MKKTTGVKIWKEMNSFIRSMAQINGRFQLKIARWHENFFKTRKTNPLKNI